MKTGDVSFFLTAANLSGRPLTRGQRRRLLLLARRGTHPGRLAGLVQQVQIGHRVRAQPRHDVGGPPGEWRLRALAEAVGAIGDGADLAGPVSAVFEAFAEARLSEAA